MIQIRESGDEVDSYISQFDIFMLQKLPPDLRTDKSDLQQLSRNVIKAS